jgi:hypothetical protein
VEHDFSATTDSTDDNTFKQFHSRNKKTLRNDEVPKRLFGHQDSEDPQVI